MSDLFFTESKLRSIIDGTDLSRYYIILTLDTLHSGGLSSTSNSTLMICSDDYGNYKRYKTLISTIDQYQNDHFLHLKHTVVTEYDVDKEAEEITLVPYSLVKSVKLIRFNFN